MGKGSVAWFDPNFRRKCDRDTERSDKEQEHCTTSQFDIGVIDAGRGTPWKPSSRHRGLNLASEDFASCSRQDIVDECLRIKPIFVVIDSKMSASTSGDLCRNQQLSMKYFVRIRGDIVETNSPQDIVGMQSTARSRVGAASTNSRREYNMQTQRIHS